MDKILKLILLLLFMGVLPVLSGFVPCALLPADKRKLSRVIPAGYFLSFSLFELIALPVLLFTDRGDFALLVRIFGAVQVFLAVLGAALSLRGKMQEKKAAASGAPAPDARKQGNGQNQERREGSSPRSAAWWRQNFIPVLLWIVFAALLLFELYNAVTHLFFDGDDAYYVASAVITDEQGTMYRVLPYTGGATSLDLRHALALFPMWVAFLARMTGFHAATVAHTLMPFLMIPLADVIFYCIADTLFRSAERRKEILPVFLIGTALLQIFGNVSIYTPETFLMMRSAQGKSVFVNIVVPAVFLAFLNLADTAERTREEKFLLLFLLLVNLTACLCSSMAVVLCGGLTILCALFLGIYRKRFRALLKPLLCVLPNLGYGILLLVLLSKWDIYFG